MLNFDDTERVSAEKALQHDYFGNPPPIMASTCSEGLEGYHSPNSSSSGTVSPTSSSSILDLSISTDSGIQET